MDHCGFEPYHVPQQSRRDKLRLISQSNLLPSPPPLLPPPSPFHHPDFHNSIKQETNNFMGFVYNSHNFILDPQNQDITTTNNPFLSSLPLPLPLPLYPQTTQHNHHQIQPQQSQDHDVVYRTTTDQVSNGQGLSLSLSSKQTNNSINHFQRIFNTNNEDNLLLLSSRSSVPLGPFTGYASILKGSRFLRPAQLLLDELCDVGNGIYTADKFENDVGLPDPSSDDFNGDGLIDDTLCSNEGTNRQRKKSTLVSMLHEVYRMYKFYYQQMHAVVASFETVAGLGNAAPYANLALKAMSKDFRSLKDAITDQLQSSYNNNNQNDDDLSSSLGNNSNPALYRKSVVHNNGDGFMDHQPVWRPQRGLPERAVTVLRAWLFEHFLHPYPTDTDKIMLAKKTGLSRSQVSNWFINARVRLWKPMVEEIHMLETRQQSQKTECQKDQHHPNNNHLPIATSSLDQNRLNSIQKSHQLELPSKRGRDDFDSSSIGHHQEQQQQPVSVPYDNLGSFLGNSNNGGGSVSLTLGLHHQNNGMSLVPDQTYPTVRRLGLDVNMNNNNNNNEGYMFGGFEGQNRPFIREIMGGQLLHDFVG
ncbi:BEL1-like homeodomain protein 9 [Impatiens glandulifera]|uniref:BEL1-like homeodomain protein 9 n=1 Tax=Impatiens glandulifera TaxID=253017 RepID=UPI001FB08BF3|nr:BEL1-like homeodomain protein 9 [Impatiens glandulifera]